MERLDRLERLTNLVLVLLDTPRPMTLRQIANVVTGYPEGEAACRQAFERDKRTLREEGVPISVEPAGTEGQVGYRIRAEDYYLPELGLTSDEQVALNLAVAGVHLDDASGREALSKLGSLYPGPGAQPPRLAALPSLPALPLLHEAIRNRSTVRFRYRSRDREMDPYGLVFRHGNWYLVGFDHGHDQVRTFRADRMESSPSVGERDEFAPPAHFEPESVVAVEPWQLGDAAEDEVEAEVLVDPVMGPRVAAELGGTAVVERREDSSLVVGLKVTNEDAFRSWLLGLLDHAVVLGPADLRRRVVEWLTALADA